MSGVLTVLALFMGACASKKPFTMMPAPVLYEKTDLDPFAHLGASHRTTSSKVFYATNRAQAGVGDKLSYGNRVDHNMNLGIAHIRMGKLGESWKDLKAASLADSSDRQIPLTVQSVEALASLPVKAPISSAELPPDVKAFTNAIDEKIDIFLDRVKPISELADQVLLTVSDDDNTLRSAKKTMGGNTRVGAEAALAEEEEYIARNHSDNIEIINVSEGKEKRGFDIVGHHYWYRHPWISSDIIFSMRTGLVPHQRGLSEAEMSGVWFLSPDYPCTGISRG